MAGAVANVGAAIVANHEKIAQVAGAVASLDAPGWTWFGLASEGGGRRNEMSISNGTRHSIELEKMYIHWGRYVVSFIMPGSWAATGSSGIVTYKLHSAKLHSPKSLHIMWDCPFNFDYYDNFIGLMLTSNPSLLIPDESLFNNMHHDWQNIANNTQS
ncbi:hypothetical protein OS493_030070 [Desmophyllum pertusum]|uniref:Uncharacterized protein n=1 Tax=Desmophyllum pertusum TaxID=174260 RepID=A0A9W9ZBY7_9CNID|nr:hypothetical protein OS493_030070 [Desmophyllum pertusum]